MLHVDTQLALTKKGGPVSPVTQRTGHLWVERPTGGDGIVGDGWEVLKMSKHGFVWK